jgi:nucleoid DNA-binding protein
VYAASWLQNCDMVVDSLLEIIKNILESDKDVLIIGFEK